MKNFNAIAPQQWADSVKIEPGIDEEGIVFSWYKFSIIIINYVNAIPAVYKCFDDLGGFPIPSVGV